MSAVERGPVLRWRDVDEIDNQWHADVGGIQLQVDLDTDAEGRPTEFSWQVSYIDQASCARGHSDTLKGAQAQAEAQARDMLVRDLASLDRRNGEDD